MPAFSYIAALAPHVFMSLNHRSVYIYWLLLLSCVYISGSYFLSSYIGYQVEKMIYIGSAVNLLEDFESVFFRENCFKFRNRSENVGGWSTEMLTERDERCPTRERVAAI